jgi:hypothetical protein
LTADDRARFDALAAEVARRRSQRDQAVVSGGLTAATPAPTLAVPTTKNEGSRVAAQEAEAKLLVSDLLEIGMQQRQRHADLARAQAERLPATAVASPTSPRASAPTTSSTPRGSSANAPAPAASIPTKSIVAVLRPSTRGATAIAALEGRVEVFAPTAANGGIVSLVGFAAQPGKPLVHDSLAAAGVELIYLTTEAVARGRAELAAGGARAVATPWTEAFATRFADFAERATRDGRSPVLFRIDDPGQKLVAWELQAPDGQSLGGAVTADPLIGVRGWTMAAPLPVDARLVVRLATPDAVRSFPFRLADLALP